MGAIPTQESQGTLCSYQQGQTPQFINDKVKDGRVTKLKVIITAAQKRQKNSFLHVLLENIGT